MAVCGADLSHTKLEHSEAEKLLDLSQYIFLFTMHQSSSSGSDLHSKLKFFESPLRPEFGEANSLRGPLKSPKYTKRCGQWFSQPSLSTLAGM